MGIRSYSFLSFFLFLLSIAFISCTQKPEKEITNGVYFWKSEFLLTQNEINWITENNIKKLYLRFFDVDWNPQTNTPLPVGDVTVSTKSVKEVEIIPVIFITNRTLKNINDSLITELSNNIYKKVMSKAAVFDSLKINELQLDCDWTTSTREKYFKLIEHLSKKCSEQKIDITATIRLHQVKFYDRTGVPPVTKGMLMFYNMCDVSDIEVKNSIFDEKIAQKYLVNFDEYPLTLDIVLPAFSWVCQFHNGKLIALVNDVTKFELENNPNFVRANENLSRAVNDCWLKGSHISVGDYLRAEQVEPSTTLAAAEMIAPHIKNLKVTVSIYHLNGEVIKNYDKKIISDIVTCFD